MDVSPEYKYIELFRGGVQWYVMESKDCISIISFGLKTKMENWFHSTDRVLISDYQLKKFNSF